MINCPKHGLQRPAKGGPLTCPLCSVPAEPKIAQTEQEKAKTAHRKQLLEK